MPEKLCIAGLGNPGEEYAQTRHNVGWMVLDSFARAIDVDFEEEDGMDARVARRKYAGNQLVLIEPQSYMNLSGRPIAQLLAKESLEVRQLVVIHDDLDLEPGRIKLQVSRGAGGHNGVDDIIERLQSKDFARLRFGIGRKGPEDVGRDYVLSPFKKQEWSDVIEPAIERATGHVKTIARLGLRRAMNEVNRTERERWRELTQPKSELEPTQE